MDNFVFGTNKNGDVLKMTRAERMEQLEYMVRKMRESIKENNQKIFENEIDFICEALKVEITQLFRFNENKY